MARRRFRGGNDDLSDAQLKIWIIIFIPGIILTAGVIMIQDFNLSKDPNERSKQKTTGIALIVVGVIMFPVVFLAVNYVTS